VVKTNLAEGDHENMANRLLKPWPVLLLCLAAIAAFRTALVWHSYLAFGSDMGSYLMTKNWILGQDPNGIQLAHFRPPLIGVMMVPFTVLWGDLMGSKILWLLLSVTPALGMYVLAKRFVQPWLAMGAALAIVLLPMNARLTTLNQISLPAMALALWGLAELVDASRGAWGAGSWWSLVALPVFLLAGLNQTTMGMFAILAIVFVSFNGNKGYTLRILGISGLVSLPWLWFYQTNIPIVSGLYTPGAPLWNIMPNFTLWWWLLPLGFGLVLPKLRPIAVLGIVALGLGQVVIPETAIVAILDRMARYVPVFGLLVSFGLLEEAMRRGWWVLRWQNALALPIMVVGLQLMWLGAFHESASRFNFVTPNTLMAMEWLKQNTAPDAKVMAHPDALGWYVGGYAQKRWAGTSGRGEPQRAYKALDNAFVVSMGWKQGNPYDLRDKQGVDYLLIDRASWQTVNDDRQGWVGLTLLPWWAILWEQEETVILGWR